MSSTTSSDHFECEKNVPAMHNLKELIEELHVVFSSDRVNVDYVKALLASYKSNPKDWRKFTSFDTHRYTRNLVDTGNGKFNLMLLCWGEGHGSSIHDHSDSHCFVKMLAGQLKETMFEWPSSSEEGVPLRETGINIYNADEVSYINDSIGLHRMENPDHADKTISLHLYSPPFDACKTFDQRTGHQNFARVTFWTKFGERTPCTAEANGCAVVDRQQVDVDPATAAVARQK